MIIHHFLNAVGCTIGWATGMQIPLP